MAQINDKGYMVPFEADGRKLVKIGVSFSTETRTVEDWSYEKNEGVCQNYEKRCVFVGFWHTPLFYLSSVYAFSLILFMSFSG